MRLHLSLDDVDAFSRGTTRGRALATALPFVIEQYLRLIELGGMTRAEARALTGDVAAAVHDWRPQALAEMRGIAEGANVPEWHILALNARTELLMSQPDGVTFGAECSTVALETVPGAIGIQTWDWQDELANFWHLQTVTGPGIPFVGITEHGILAKIGLNNAGLGVFLNILSSEDDHIAGVPVHVLIAAILEDAHSGDEAVDMLRSAPIAGSSNLTLIDRAGARAVELSPNGVAVLGSNTAGFVIHTNHFRSDEQIAGERRGRFGADSVDRERLLEQRTSAFPSPTERDELDAYLQSGPGEPNLSCRLDPTARFGLRVRTLATVRIDTRLGALDVRDGAPMADNPHGWQTMLLPA